MKHFSWAAASSALLAVAGCTFSDVPAIDAPVVADGPDVDAAVDAASCIATTCTSSVLQVCGPGGFVESVETCRLGCFSDTRCNWVAPSNGLGVHLATAAAQTAVTLAAGSTVDSDTGVVRSAGGGIIAVATDTMQQPGGAAIRVLIARAWAIGDIRVTGTAPVAFIAIDDVEVTGTIDASADGVTMGSGSSSCVTGQGQSVQAIAGHWSVRRAGHSGQGTYVWHTPGSGGGGFGGPGAAGGALTSPAVMGAAGGAANGVAVLVPLRGGCTGGRGAPC